MVKIINKIQRRVLFQLKYIIAFSAILAFLGWLVPEIYYRYIDQREYISFADAVTFDRKVYEPCDNMKALITTNNLIDAKIDTIYELRRIEGKGISHVVYKKQERSFAAKTREDNRIQVFDVKIPCDLTPGIYLFKGVISYQVKGYDRDYVFITPQFTVVKNDTNTNLQMQ